MIRGLVKGELPWPWFLFGSVGSGKTCAALCMLDYSGGLYWTAAEWAERLNAAREGRLVELVEDRLGVWGPDTKRNSQIWPDDLWRSIKRTPLVVIDEIGAREKASDHQYESVKRVLDYRWGKPTIFVANVGLKQVATIYGQPLADRLAEGTVTELSGPSRRIRE